MKKVLVVIAAFVAAAAVASAQDYNAGIEAFNAGATALQTSKTEALGSFRAALTQFEACEEEEAAEMVAKCKEIIPETILSIAKEQINGSEYDNALTTLAEAVAVAKEYGIENTATEAKELIPNVYMRKGSTLIKEKNFADAVAAFKEVVNLDPDNG